MSRRCAIVNCEDKTSSKHRFPNPKQHLNRFKLWMKACQNPPLFSLTKENIYSSKRICTKHFMPADISRNNRLFPTAIPKLHLPSKFNLLCIRKITTMLHRRFFKHMFVCKN